MTADRHAPPVTAAGWARRNLFRNRRDAALTVVFGALSLYALTRAIRFVFVTGRWEIVQENLTLFLVGAYDRDEMWRPAVALVVAAGLGGLVAGVIHRRALEAAALSGASRPSARARWRDVAGRWWPVACGVLLLLVLAETVTPWLVVFAAIVAAVVGRSIGVRLPKRLFVATMGTVVVTSAAMVWMLASAQGWDEWGGLMLNFFLAAVSIVLCFPLGVLLALGRRSKLPVVRALSTAYIEIARGVPLIALLLMANVALGFFIPLSMAPGKVVRAIVVFTLFTAAYVAEIVRGGLQGLAPGQREAARALGLSPVRVTMLVELPQAVRAVIPALVGQFISLFKDTTLAGAAMGFLDLLAAAQAATAQPQFRGQGLIAETLAFVLLLFWIGSYTMSRESQRLEAKLGVGER